jgi:hypothetical protein
MNTWEDAQASIYVENALNTGAYSKAVVTNMWFANTLLVRKIFQGIRGKESAIAYFLF